MRKFLALIALVGILAWASTALAAEQTDLYCLDMPGCCTFNCVMIDLDCCGCSSGSGVLEAQFLNMKGDVLGTALFAGDWCCGETTGQLDKPVNSNDVCSVRLIKPDNCVTVTWASLRVFCNGNGCDCGKWKKIFKGDLWCWTPVPVAPAPAPEAPPAEVVPPPMEVTPPPAQEERPDFDYQPEPQPEEPTEVIVVPGKG